MFPNVAIFAYPLICCENPSNPIPYLYFWGVYEIDMQFRRFQVICKIPQVLTGHVDVVRTLNLSFKTFIFQVLS